MIEFFKKNKIFFIVLTTIIIIVLGITLGIGISKKKKAKIQQEEQAKVQQELISNKEKLDKAEELKSKKWVQVIKILFICATCFFGAGITVMGYNNDVDMVKVFGQLYKVFLGTKPDDPTFVELFYSVGLALGIFLFFNHVPGKKVTNEPTPIQVQMRLYEQDVNRTFLLGASRKGEELDVSGNNDSANNK